jgi:hypothetical protein
MHKGLRTGAGHSVGTKRLPCPYSWIGQDMVECEMEISRKASRILPLRRVTSSPEGVATFKVPAQFWQSCWTRCRAYIAGYACKADNCLGVSPDCQFLMMQ